MSGITQMLLGSGLTRVKALSKDIGYVALDPEDAYTGIRYGTGGYTATLAAGSSAGWSTDEQWRFQGANSDYEIRCTYSGSAPNGTSDSTSAWLALSSQRQWMLQRLTLGTSTTTLTIEIRDASTLAVLSSSTVTLTATVDPLEP